MAEYGAELFGKPFERLFAEALEAPELMSQILVSVVLYHAPRTGFVSAGHQLSFL